MRKLILHSAAAFCAVAAVHGSVRADWQHVTAAAGQATGKTYYFDPQRVVQPKPGFRKGWVLAEFAQAERSGDGSRLVTSELRYQQFDCESRTSALQELIQYADASRKDMAYTASRQESELVLRPVVPGSIGEQVLDAVCRAPLK
jgi:hypothetical protein